MVKGKAEKARNYDMTVRLDSTSVYNKKLFGKNPNVVRIAALTAIRRTMAKYEKFDPQEIVSTEETLCYPSTVSYKHK